MGRSIPSDEKPARFTIGPYSRIKWARADCKGKLKAAATALYCYIAERAGPGRSGHDFKCTASVKTMASDLNISRRAVQELLHDLHWRCWIQASWTGEGRGKRFEWAVLSEHELFVDDDRYDDPEQRPSHSQRSVERWRKRRQKVAEAATACSGGRHLEAEAATREAEAATREAEAAPDQEREVEREIQGEVKGEPLACARPLPGENIQMQEVA